MESSGTKAHFESREEYFAPPHSINILPEDIRYGLIVVSICGLASFLSTLTLFSFLIYRFLTWRTHYKIFIGYNQYIVLFLNLILADLIQSTAFVISFYWIDKNAILAPTPPCTAQGLLLHLGNVSSAFFVLAIAVHTFTTAALGYRISYRIFSIGIAVIWAMGIFLTILGLAMYAERYFVRAGAWCWVSSEYQAERLGLHYVWVFLAEFGLMLLYFATFVKLRRKTSHLFADQNTPGDAANQTTVKAVNRITKLMMLYPMVYVLLTLPLSAVRMWSMAQEGEQVNNATACAVGALIASCGWVDCVLYSLTRKRLMQETMGVSTRSGGHSRTDPEAVSKCINSIMKSTTVTVRNESIDGGSARGGGNGMQAIFEDSQADNPDERQRSRLKGPDVREQAADRSPSPTSSVEPILARERGGVKRILSDARKSVGMNDSYELRPLPKQLDWRTGT